MLFQCTTHAAADHRRGKTVSDGKKFFTVDVHCHVHVQEAANLISELSGPSLVGNVVDSNPLTAEINRKQNETIYPKLTDPAVRIADMDKQGIDIQAISPSPFHYAYHYEPDVTRQSCVAVNDRIAEIVAGNPDRFVGICTVPLQDAQMAVAELDRCVNTHGMRGVEISTNVNGQDLTRAGLESFFSRVEELGVMIFMHPIGTSVGERMNDHYFRNLIGHPLESALAVGHLIFDGYLEKYSDLKICIAHGGGYAPAYAGRFDHPYHLRDDCRQHIDRPPSQYLQKLYFDTVVFTESQLRYLIEEWGADHVVMGTDYPYDMAETDPVGHVNSVKGLNAVDRALVLGGNAAALLGIDVPAQ